MDFINKPMDWNNTGIEIPSTIKESGWNANDKPPANYFNFKWSNDFAVQTELQQIIKEHVENIDNPHSVTKVQIGLENVDNTSDLNKPISTATQTALEGKASIMHTHVLSSLTGAVTLSQLPKGTNGYTLIGTGASTAPKWREPLPEPEILILGSGSANWLATYGVSISNLYGYYLVGQSDNLDRVYNGELRAIISVAKGYEYLVDKYKLGLYIHTDNTYFLVTACSLPDEDIPLEITYIDYGEGVIDNLTKNKNVHLVSTKTDYQQTVFGRYNVSSNGPSSVSDTTGDIFIIGNGTGDTERTNCLRITTAGKCYGSQSFGSSGADFAEYAEWLDGNPNNEDRRGLFVSLEGEKIKLAGVDDYILGVVSATPTITGGTHSENWKDMYLTDIFGTPLTETVIENGKSITKFVLNPNYNPTLTYVGREKRKEWSPICVCGFVIVVDDGTSKVGGYCTVSENGIATDSDTGYKVLSRIDETHIKIVFK